MSDLAIDNKKAFLFPLITAVLLLAIWHFATSWGDLPTYILPNPQSVGLSLWRGLVTQGNFWPHIGFTLKSIVVGYCVGGGAAIILGILLSESKTAELLLYPYVIAMQSIPKIALAPLIIVWFGYDLTSKVVMVALICFFPIFVNTFIGLKNTNKDLIDLYCSFSARRSSVLWNVKLPSAAGSIFAGLQVGQVLALLGAIVAEFAGSRMGLGYLIQSAAVALDVAMVFAIVVVLAVIGVCGTQLIRLIHRRLIFWERV